MIVVVNSSLVLWKFTSQNLKLHTFEYFVDYLDQNPFPVNVIYFKKTKVAICDIIAQNALGVDIYFKSESFMQISILIGSSIDIDK